MKRDKSVKVHLSTGRKYPLHSQADKGRNLTDAELNGLINELGLKPEVMKF